MNMVKCPYCGTEHSEGTCFDACPHCHAPHQPSWAKFCNSCGAELTPTAPLPVDTVIATKRCPQCHTAGLPESAAFCSVCGYDFNARKESPRIVITCVRGSFDGYTRTPGISIGKRGLTDYELKEGVNILRLSQHPWLTTKELDIHSGTPLVIQGINIINARLKNRINFRIPAMDFDVSNIDTSDWIELNSCFWSCGRLEKLDLSTFNTNKVKSLNSCFSCCYNLNELNLSGWDLTNVVGDDHRTRIFENCKSLRTIIMRGCNDYTVDLVETALEEAGLNNVEIIR